MFTEATAEFNGVVVGPEGLMTMDCPDRVKVFVTFQFPTVVTPPPEPLPPPPGLPPPGACGIDNVVKVERMASNRSRLIYLI
jgi:hypothetical protein